MQIFQSQRSQMAITKNVDFLNDSVAYHMETLQQKSDKPKIMQLLQRISEYSVSTLGVSWLSTKSMANIISVSTRTIRRYIAELTQLNILSKISTARDRNGSQTSNTYIIMPVLRRYTLSLKMEQKYSMSTGVSDQKNPSLKHFKQEKYKEYSEDDDRLHQLFKYKMKDREVQYGSMYLEKVINTIMKEYEDIERQQEFSQIQRSEETLPKYPNINWLNTPLEKENTSQSSVSEQPQPIFSQQHCDDFWEMFTP